MKNVQLIPLFALTLLLLAVPAWAQSATCADSLIVEGDADAMPVEPGDECQDHTDSTTLCVGNQMCKSAGNNYVYPVNGACDAAHTLVALGSVDEACTAAASVTNPAPCNRYCESVDVKVEQSKNATCCTVKKTRICEPIGG